MRILLALATVFWVITALPGAIAAMMVPMMFDAPGSEGNGGVIVAALAMLAYPVTALLSPLAAWLAWWRGRRRAAVWFILLPLLPVALLTAGMAYVQVNCGGSFSCDGG